MIIKCLRPPRLRNLMPANQTLLVGTRSCSSPQPSLTVQAIECMQIPKVIQIFRRNQSASDGCLLIEMPSPRCRGGTATLQWPSLRVTSLGNSCRCFIEEAELRAQSVIVLCNLDSLSASRVRLAPRPHATQVVAATGDAAVESTRRTQVWFGTHRALWPVSNRQANRYFLIFL